MYFLTLYKIEGVPQERNKQSITRIEPQQVVLEWGIKAINRFKNEDLIIPDKIFISEAIRPIIPSIPLFLPRFNGYK